MTHKSVFASLMARGCDIIVWLLKLIT